MTEATDIRSWLHGLIGIQPRVSGVPQTPARVWDLIGVDYAYDPQTGVATITFTGGSTILGDPHVTIAAAAGHVAIDSDTYVAINSGDQGVLLGTSGDTPGVNIGHSAAIVEITAGTFTIAAATSAQIDAPEILINGEAFPIGWKRDVRVASTALTIPATSTADGVACVAGNRALFHALTTASARGIYVWNGSAWVRASDADSTADWAQGCRVAVREGTFAGSIFVCTASNIVLGTTALTWAQVGTGGGGLSNPQATSAQVWTDDTSWTITIDDGVGGGSFLLSLGGTDSLEWDTVNGLTVSAPAGITLAAGASAGIDLVIEGSNTFRRGVLGSGWTVVEDVSGANLRIREYDAAGTLSRTTLVDNAAIAETIVGAYALSMAGGGVTWDVNDADGGESTIDTVGGNTIQSSAGSVRIQGATTADVFAPSVRIGAASTRGLVIDETGANTRIVEKDAAGNTARTTLLDDAAVDETIVGSYTLGHAGSRLLQGTRPSTDVRPPPSQEIVARATSLAPGSTTAANKVGGHKVTELGRAQTEGTDEPGGWFIGLGGAVGGSITNGLNLGYGAATGTPGTDGYRPYTTHLARHSAIGDTYEIRALRPLTLRTVTTAHTLQIISADAMTLTAAGNLSGSTAGGVVSWDASASFTQLSAFGAINLFSDSMVAVGRRGVGVERIGFRTPADVATSSTSRSVLATIPIPTGAMRRIRASVKGWPAGAAGGAWTVDVHVENIGGTLTEFADTIALVTGTQNLGTIDTTINGTNLEIGVTPGAATAYTWHVNDLGDV